jgi:hypothetical protein
MENKLSENSQILDNELSQFRYVYSRLKKKAKEQVTTFVEVGVNNRAGTTKELLYRFDLLYGQRNRKQRAIRNLSKISKEKRNLLPYFILDSKKRSPMHKQKIGQIIAKSFIFKTP